MARRQLQTPPQDFVPDQRCGSCGNFGVRQEGSSNLTEEIETEQEEEEEQLQMHGADQVTGEDATLLQPQPHPDEGMPVNFFGWRRQEHPPDLGYGDYWEVMFWAGCLVRHHVDARTTMFGNVEADWEYSPVDPTRLRSERRSWMRPEGGGGPPVAVHDNWKEEFQLRLAGVDRPGQERDPWIGRTLFYFMADVNEEEINAPPELLPASPSPQEDQCGGEPDDQGGDGEEEGEGRDASRSRSRSRDDSRRVGYMEASPVLEALDVESMIPGDFTNKAGGGPPIDFGNVNEYEEGTLCKAKEYVHFCRKNPSYSPETVKRATELGDELLLSAGCLERAMGALRLARREIIGIPTAGAVEEKVIQCLDSNHAEYLKEMNEKGIPSRRSYPATRLKAEPYPSAMDHIAEMFEKSWKDGHWGIVLFATDATEHCTPNLVECPQGRVPKQLPDRSISSEGRPIHAMLVSNAATHKWQHPPAVQPRHRQIARKALWWSARNPGIRCTLAKLDVSRAFKWHDVDPGSCSDFGSALPGEEIGVPGRVKMIYGGLPFGWSGSPGEYMIFALAGRAYHENFKPTNPEVNGPTSFSSEWLMDDSVIVEPLLGVRPWLAVDALGHSIEQIWGEAALNLSKQKVEGTPAPEQIVWGLIMNMDSMTVRLPEPKALKMRYLLALPELQFGSRQIRLKTMRELRGLAQYAAITVPPLKTELSVIDQFLSPLCSDGGFAKPKCAAEDSARTWEALDEVLEVMRVWFEVPYEGNFEASFEGVLTTRELLALRGMARRLRWVGGDATLEVIGTLDWKDKRYMRENAKDMIKQLGGIADIKEDPEVQIAVAELVCYIGFAAAEGHAWNGDVVAYATDNQNVRSWLTKRKANNALARHLLRVLGMLETRYNFRTLAFYIRTYHNMTADWVSRESKVVVEDTLAKEGWVKIDALEDWENYLLDAAEGMFKWPGGDVLRAKARSSGSVTPPLYKPVVAVGKAIELGHGRLPWAIAWVRLGGEIVVEGGVTKPWDEAVMQQTLNDPAVVQGDDEVEWLFGSLSEDSWGRGQANMRKYVRMLHPNAVLLDMPHAGPVSGVVETLGALGYEVATLECRTSDFGDGVAKLKVIIVGSRGRKASLCSMPPARAIEPNGICRCLKEAGNRIAPDWVGEGCQIELNAKISTSGDRMLPWPAGHLYIEGEKQLIYDARGPALTFRKDAKMPIVDHQGRDSQCRWLRPEEEWIINGGRIEELEAMREVGAASCQFKDGAIKRMPQNSAHHILAWLERERQRGGDQRVGLCADRDRQNTDEQVKAWLKAWKGNSGNPATQYEKFLKDERENSLVGGRKPSKGGRRAKSSPPETTVFPAAIGQGRERLMLDANRELSKDKEWLDALAAEAVMSKLSEGTRAGYEIGWKQWCLWRRLEKNGAYLLGETKDERKQDEDEILRFITFLAKVMKRTEGTIKQRIFAIKMGHLVAGHDDPTLNRSRIWAALNGFKRWQPETKRKYPVLPSMLRWMKTHLESSHTLTKDDAKILWAAVMVGFFFLLRASEFLVCNARSWSGKRVLKGVNVEGRKGNKVCASLSEADEVVIFLAGSKTDQYNQGCVRNQFRSGGQLCVVEALASYQRAYPERFIGAEEGEPLFRYTDGSPIQRTDIQSLIQLSALADGQAMQNYGSHSLRIGGATALYQITNDLETVKRFGRWNSTAFHGYLWESHEKQRDLAKGMANADGHLTAPRPKKDQRVVSSEDSKMAKMACGGTDAAAAKTAKTRVQWAVCDAAV